MAENVLKVEFLPSNIKEKKRRESVLKEIKTKVCALLNTNGGKLVLTASDATADNNIDADKVIRPIEQYFGSTIGPFEISNIFQVLQKKYNTITLGIEALSILCTLNTYLFVPTITEIRLISCMEQDAIRRMLFERRSAEEVKHKVAESFISKCDCGLRESKAVQFKHLKAEKSKTEKSKPKKKTPTDFADRVINNKFTDIISAFANARGGNIFYGINDNGIVEGELLPDSEHNEVTKKLEKAVGKMIWRDKSRKVERGREWDIKFVPVKDCNNATIPSIFVMVVTVHPYIGGVFTKEPESYYVEDGEVKKMPFDVWRQNMYYKATTPVKELERKSWSTEENRRKYMKITQTLENLRQLGDWGKIEQIVNEIKKRETPVNAKLTCRVQTIAVSYRQGNYDEAQKSLEEFREDMSSAEDNSIFDVKERYSASAIERARGNYQEAWEKIKEGLKLAHNAPAGLIPAAVYVNAASILSSLVDDESPKSCMTEISRAKILEHIERGKSLCHRALQHLLYIEDEFVIAREDLRQRINITLASLCVKLADPELSISSPDSEINEAMKLITESAESFMKLKGTKLKYNSCRQLLVKSDIHFQSYKLKQTDIRNEHLKESLECVQEAQNLADDNGFKEIRRLCEKRMKKIDHKNVQTKQAEQGEDKQTQEIMDMDELFS